MMDLTRQCYADGNRFKDANKKFKVNDSMNGLALDKPFRPRNNTQVWSWTMIKHSQILD
jgi:hypothetical protein